MKNKFLWVLLPSLTFACSGPPRTLSSPIKDLVKRTEHIVLATVQWDEAPLNNFFHLFTFEVDSNLKGEMSGEFTLYGHLAKDDENISDEYAILPGGCKAYGNFKTGETYLIFLGKYSHVKSFQRVKDDNDTWVSNIKELIRKDDGIGVFYESQAYRRKCSSCHGFDALGKEKDKRLMGPKLLGKSADYIFEKLMDFKTGREENIIMKGLLKKLTEEELRGFADEIGGFSAH